MNRTAAVVVTYNRIELLKQCIDHLQKQSVPVDILIIDNASTDGTSDHFESVPDNLLYFNTGTNLGGAGGFNFGMRKAVELGYEYVWVMDDDTLPSPESHQKLLEADTELEGKYGFLSSRVIWTDNSPCNMNIQKITKWKKLTNFENFQSVQYASFVSLFLKSETIRRFGLPIKEFFIWSDDWEFTRRISKQVKSYYIPSSVVTHACKSNVGADIVTADPDRIDRFRYLYRNDVILYRLDGFDGFFYLAIRTVKHILNILIKSNNKCIKIKLMIKSLNEGLRFKPNIEFIE